MTTDSSLLSSELELEQQEELYQQLLLQVNLKLKTKFCLTVVIVAKKV